MCRGVGEGGGKDWEPAEGGQAPPARRARGPCPHPSHIIFMLNLRGGVGGADACVRLAGHVLNLDVVLCVALAPGSRETAAPDRGRHEKEMKPMVVAMMRVLMSKGKGTVARVLLASPSPGWLEMKAKVLLG